jgi:transketolase N-terminal domain/subunit
MEGGHAMATSADEHAGAEQDGIAHRVARRNANKRTSATTDATTDGQGLADLGCECARIDCDLSVRMPLDVYRRMVEADQYILRRGHHAFASYRTIIATGLIRIEERA